MKRYKLLKSECAKTWLFNVHIDSGFLRAGFACFLPGHESEVAIVVDGVEHKAVLPSKIVNNVLPIRIVNARLCLLK
jgi:hypothetical protein